MKEFTTGHDDFVTDGNYFRLFDAYGTRVTDFVCELKGAGTGASWGGGATSC